MPTVSVQLEEDTQLIVQRVEGILTPESFDLLHDLTAECVARLRDPTDVRILMDSRQLGKSSLATRKRGIAIIRDKNVRKIAFFGGSRLGRVMQLMVLTVIGGRRVGMFGTEQEARSWIMK